MANLNEVKDKAKELARKVDVDAVLKHTDNAVELVEAVNSLNTSGGSTKVAKGVSIARRALQVLSVLRVVMKR